ncbi:MAG: dephospho-CoA kinase [Clostridia bacterium]|nr:dephospho-CoA kinase [Clostridia bacterium]
MSFIVGLTGPTGSGKGVFAECAKEFGFKVIDCDLVARKAVKKGMPALKALTYAFGEEILLESGELNRQKLAQVAFSSADKTELLNKTVLPYIKELVMAEICGERVLLDAPTLFESGIDEICDVTVAVTAPVDVREKRIIKRDGLAENAAKTRISAGKPDEFYRERANIVIKNDNGIENFIKTAKIYLGDIIGGIKI